MLDRYSKHKSIRIRIPSRYCFCQTRHHVVWQLIPMHDTPCVSRWWNGRCCQNHELDQTNIQVKVNVCKAIARQLLDPQQSILQRRPNVNLYVKTFTTPIELLVKFNFCRAMLCKRGLCRHAVSARLSVCVFVCHVHGFCQN